MDLPRDLLAQLDQLAARVGAEPTGLDEPATGLVADLHSAVSGYAGLAVTVVQSGHPVTLALVDPGLVRVAVTSLGLPLRQLSPSYEDGGRAVFYSATPGAFVDLAADLRHVLERPGSGGTPALDVDLPPISTCSGLRGLEELATVHRATGVLMEQGHDPDTALGLLRHQALAAGVAVHVVAARLLTR